MREGSETRNNSVPARTYAPSLASALVTRPEIRLMTERLRPSPDTLAADAADCDRRASASASASAAAAPSRSCRAVTRASNRRSEEHTSELQSLMRISSAVFCLKKKKSTQKKENAHNRQERS